MANTHRGEIDAELGGRRRTLTLYRDWIEQTAQSWGSALAR